MTFFLAHRDAGARLDHLHDGGEIRLAAVLRIGQPPTDRARRSSPRSGMPKCLGLREEQPHVLDHQRHAEAVVERARQDRSAETSASVAVLRPQPALMTSIITAGSSPALTPIAIASERRRHGGGGEEIVGELHALRHARLVADDEHLAEHSRARPCTTSMSSCGPDTMTASVPFSAPPTPPLTGESICTMLRSSAAPRDLRPPRASRWWRDRR